MSHSITTFQRIVALYDEERQLLDKYSHEYLTEAEQARFADIRANLAKLWPQRRADLVFEADGPPRITGNAQPLDRRRMTAYGIAPLPNGGAYD